MSGKRKFGTFAGVFTPSILTILGVIMYMRLGWVVGNSGLLGAIAIIIIAHIIAVTTGLSVSSIATDKKIESNDTPIAPKIINCVFKATEVLIRASTVNETKASVPVSLKSLTVIPRSK